MQRLNKNQRGSSLTEYAIVLLMTFTVGTLMYRYFGEALIQRTVSIVEKISGAPMDSAQKEKLLEDFLGGHGT